MTKGNEATHRRLASQLSYEVRSSLNAIVGFSEMLEQGFYGELQREQLLGVEAIRQAGHHLLGILDDLLTVAQAEETASLKDDLVDLRALLEVQTERMCAMLREPGLTIELDTAPALPRLRADAEALGQVMQVLLSNAVKSTLPPGTIQVRAETRADGGITILVQDDGIGIPADQLTRLHKAETGVDIIHDSLELLSVRGLIEAHGGTMEVESAIDQGTRIRLHLPPERSLA